jgi:hypothetical protein
MAMLSLLIQQYVKQRYAAIKTYKNERVPASESIRIEPGEHPVLVGADLVQLPTLDDDELKALAEGIEQALELWLTLMVTAPPPAGKLIVPPTGEPVP